MKKYIAEFFGTFALVFCGTGAVVIDEITHGAVTHAGVAICFGLIVMCMIYAFGERSGAHLNPAVTIAFFLHGSFAAREIIPYLISQLAGAISASVLLHVLFPESQLLGATMPSGTDAQSFILEVVLSFFLMLVIIAVATGSKEQGLFAGIAIGGIVLLEAMFAGPISGASMNPARSFAPALVSGNFTHCWIYIVAPIAGTSLAIPVHYLIR